MLTIGACSQHMCGFIHSEQCINVIMMKQAQGGLHDVMHTAGGGSWSGSILWGGNKRDV